MKITFHFFIFLTATYCLIATLAESNFLKLFLITDSTYLLAIRENKYSYVFLPTNASRNSTQGRCVEMLKKLTQWFSRSKPMVYDL